jgi:azurin
MKYLSIFTIVVLLAACSQPASNENNSEETAETTETTQPTEEVSATDTIEISGMGNTMAEIKFSKDRISVAPKTMVTIALTNKSTNASMPHNFVVIEKGKANDVGQAGVMNADNGYVKPNDINVIAHTAVANIGETVYLTFETPAAGEYEFICSYPGHWSLMKGDFIVE